MLVRILLLGLAIWLVLSLLKRYRNNVDHSVTPPSPEQDMVRCAVCGVHLPKSESILKDGQNFCCIEHSQKPHA